MDAVFISLAPVGNAEDFATAVAAALGVTADAGANLAVDVARSLRGRRRVLVFDNLEHLLHDARVTAFLHTLLERAQDAQLVVTSRERLGFAAERVLELRGLGVPASGEDDASALELFEHRARQVSATFELSRNREAVIGICQALEGIPLGIELAATWVRVLGCEEILTEITKTLDFLTADSRSGRDPRQSSMRAVFTQSWTLLDGDEQAVLARLSVFRGGFDRAAAERVTRASLPMLASLVDRSLIHSHATERTTRYEMHELLRQFAAEHLAERGEQAEIDGAHAEYFVELVQAIRPHLRGSGQVAAVADLTADLDNLRRAIEHCMRLGRYDSATRICWALWPFWWIRNLHHEGRRWLSTLLPHAEGLGLHWQIQATIALGAMAYGQGDLDAAARSGHELRVLAEKAGGDARPLSFSHGALGLVAAERGELETALADLAKSRELFVGAADPGITAQSAAWLGTVQLLAGQAAQARASASLGLSEALAAGDRLAATTARYCLAQVAVAAGQLEQAREHLLACVGPSLEINDQGSLVYVFELLGVVCSRGQSPACGARLFGASDAILAEIGNRGHTYYLADKAAAAAARSALIAELGEAFSTEYDAGRADSIEATVAVAEQATLAVEKPSNAPPASPSLAPPAPPPGATNLLVQYFERDDSIFFDHDYVIRGVAGKVLLRLLQMHEGEGRTEFTNRELRADPALNLPGFRDNLETRLLLLGRRLDEKKSPIRLERAGRGRVRLVVTRSFALQMNALQSPGPS